MSKIHLTKEYTEHRGDYQRFRLFGPHSHNHPVEHPSERDWRKPLDALALVLLLVIALCLRSVWLAPVPTLKLSPPSPPSPPAFAWHQNAEPVREETTRSFAAPAKRKVDAIEIVFKPGGNLTNPNSWEVGTPANTGWQGGIVANDSRYVYYSPTCTAHR